jgi:Kef-type K+ transport system membrane component KefB
MKDEFHNFFGQFNLPLQNPVLVFSVILLIMLLAPIFLRKLNIPGIIGLIISGVIIGPFGLNIITKNSAVELFSTIGLLYIMFIAGLELDINEFKKYRGKSFVFGFLTFIIPLSIGFPVCYYFLQYNFDASFLTASMFATHTLIAYPIVSKFGISKNQAVAITVGGTILTDTAVLLILAVIVGGHNGNLTGMFWLRLGVSLLIFSAFMFLAVPRIARWFFQKLESEKYAHYIFVLSVVFFAAFLAQAAGVEPIIGAFVAGLALNKLIPHTSALMNRIEFIGNSLFIPFFLISVGMIVNISVLTNGPQAIIVAISLSVVAISGKWLAAWITQLLFRYTPAVRQIIFGLSGAHAAATLAIILVGYQNGILDENILNGTIILILITCIVASFATEKAAKKVVIESEEEPDGVNGQTIQASEHILLPIANFENLDRLLEFSILVKDKKSANPVSILSVVSNNNEAELNIMKTRSKLETFVKQASATETAVDVIATIDLNYASGIIRISREIMADIIVMGWPQRPSLVDKIIGEKFDYILANMDKTLFLCKLNKPLVNLKRIVCTVPPLAEHENGFELWFTKLAKLSQELSLPMRIYSNTATKKSIEKLILKSKLVLSFSTYEFDDWEDFLVLSRYIDPDDLLVLVSARKGSVSHFFLLENLPGKLQKHFGDNNKILIFPQQYQQGFVSEIYDDVANEPLQKTVQIFKKQIGNIFKAGE